MKLRLRKGSWILFIAAVVAMFVPNSYSKADNIYGLNTTVYDNYTQWNEYNNAPPIPPTTPIAGTFISNRIDQSFDSNPVFGLWDDFVVKYDGYITAPCTCNIYLTAQADDGTVLYLDDQLITSDWYDKGSGGSISEPISFIEGIPKHIVLWFYENGGGAWVQLYWTQGDAWEIVPDSAFTLIASVPVDTTTTTEETTTTTVEETTTTTLPQIDTTIPEIVNTTLPQETTTTTTIPRITPTTKPEPSITTSTSTIATTTTTTPTTTTTEPSINNPNVQNLIDKISSGEITVNEALDILDSSNPNKEQVQSVIDAVIEKDIDPSTALELTLNPTVLENITSDQAAEVFSSLDVTSLSIEQEEALVTAVSDAPTEIKNQFENQINVYSSGLDKYVPANSNITVGARRTLIAVTTAITAIGVSGAGVGGNGPTGGSGGPTGRSGGSGGSSGPDNSAAKKDEEDEEEESFEIEGPEGDDSGDQFTKNSIYTYMEGTMEKRFSPIGFIKKFAKETAALAFTISGSVIVFSTLSGETRKITIIATSCAFAVHYLNAMLKNDE